MPTVLLQIDNVTKRFRESSSGKTIDALKGVSLTLYQGEILGLLGVNGAGKTTLSSIIATLHPPTSGDLQFNNQSVYKNLYAYRLKVGFCPQKPNFEKALTVRENLIFAGRYFLMAEDAIVKRAQVLMDKFELTQYADCSPSILSGGYKQRLLIARAMMHSPSLVILDEPTVGLDPHIRRNLWTVIKELKKEGVTVLLTTHYLDEAESLSDRVVILDKGLIKMIDTPSNLKAAYQKGNLEDVFIHLMESEDNNK